MQVNANTYVPSAVGGGNAPGMGGPPGMGANRRARPGDPAPMSDIPTLGDKKPEQTK